MKFCHWLWTSPCPKRRLRFQTNLFYLTGVQLDVFDYYLFKIRIINHDGEERAGFFTLFVFLVSRDCCVALPHDATGLSAVCDYDIS